MEGALGPGEGGTGMGGGASLKDCFIGFSSMACSVTLSAISSMQLPVKSTLGTGTVGLGIVL